MQFSCAPTRSSSDGLQPAAFAAARQSANGTQEPRQRGCARSALQGYCGYNAQALGSTEFVAFDPSATLVVHCANGFQPLSKYLFQRIQCSLLSLGADMRRREFITLLGGAAAPGRSRRGRSSASGCGASAS